MKTFSIGRSVQGRRIEAFLLGPEEASLRVLVIAGQHGDERPAVRAARRLARDARLPPGAAVAFVPALNPDGRAERTRTNADGLDLNRDHQKLEAPETQALHRFARQWRPHLAVDAHCYPPRRKELLRRGLANAYDVLVDWPTNPAVEFDLNWSELAARLRRRLDLGGRLCERYFLVTSSGRLRHSTPDVVDARNGLAVRYGFPVVLLEGRLPSRRDKRRRGDTAEGLRAALDETIHWAASVGAGAMAARKTAFVALSSRYRRESAVPDLVFERTSDGGLSRAFPAKRYTPGLRVLKTRTAPAAYAIPAANKALIELLERHGLHGRQALPREEREAEILTPRELRPSRRLFRAPSRISVASRPAKETLDGYVVFAARGPAAAWLTILLEPESKYGLHRRTELGLRVEPGRDYAVRRVGPPAGEVAELDDAAPCRGQLAGRILGWPSGDAPDRTERRDQECLPA